MHTYSAELRRESLLLAVIMLWRGKIAQTRSRCWRLFDNYSQGRAEEILVW